jgi:hypothetical protein
MRRCQSRSYSSLGQHADSFARGPLPRFHCRRQFRAFTARAILEGGPEAAAQELRAHLERARIALVGFLKEQHAAGPRGAR